MPPSSRVSMGRGRVAFAFLLASAAAWHVVLAQSLAQDDKTVAELADILKKEKNAKNRLTAVEQLAKAKPPAAAATPVLLLAAKDMDAAVRRVAVLTLGLYPTEAEKIVPALIDRLKDADPPVRGFAASSLQAMGPAAKPAVRALAVVVREDKSPGVRELAVNALGGLGADAEPALPAIISVLGGKKAEVFSNGNGGVLLDLNGAARSAIARIGPTAIPALLTALNDPRFGSPVRCEAADLLGGLVLLADGEPRGEKPLPPDVTKIIPVLVKSLASEDTAFSYAAMKALRLCGSHAVEPVAAALKVPKTTRLASQVLIDERTGGMPVVLEALKQKNPKMIQDVLQGVCNHLELDGRNKFLLVDEKLGDKQKAAWARSMREEFVPEVVRLLKDNDPGVRTLSADAAQAMWKIAEPAVPALLENLKHKDKGVQRSAVHALGQIRTPAAIDGLVGGFRSKHAEVREATVDVFSSIGRPAVPTLTKALDDKETASGAKTALARIGK